MVMFRALRFVRCVRHHKPSQLARRAQRLALRALAEKLGPNVLFGARAPRPAPDVSAIPPQPLFRPRLSLVNGEADEIDLELQQSSIPLRHPMDWRLESIPARPLLMLFHLHGMQWLEALDDEAFQRAVLDWIARVHPDRDRATRDAWHPFVISIRAVVWMQQAARRRRRVPAEFRARLERSIADQIRVLEDGLELDLGGNHLLKNAKALLWAGAFFHGPEAQRWSRRAAAVLEQQIDEQILPDGMHFERSPAYHAQVVADLLECRAILHAGALRDRIDGALERAVQALADLTHPDGAPSLFNDGGLHMAYATREILDVHARLLQRAPIVRPVFGLESAGYYGARAGKSYVLADCGAIGPDHLPAHGHADALAFEWTVAGERLIVDAGVFEYEPGAMRDMARATKSHNTVTLDDHDQCEFWSSFRVGRRCRVRRTRWQVTAEGFVLEGTHDGFAHLPGEPMHRRTLRATPHEIRIDDRVEGGAGQIARARFLLHPECRVTTDADGVVTIRRGRAIARLVSESPIAVVEALWCPDFGIRLPTKQLVVTYGGAPCVGGVWLRSLTPDRVGVVVDPVVARA